MKRLLLITIIVMLFGTTINVIITLNQIQINNTIKSVLTTSLEGQKIGHENQEIIIKNQKDIFKYSANATKTNMDILQGMLNNQSHLIIKALNNSK